MKQTPSVDSGSEVVADIHAARELARNWLTAMRGGISPRNLRNRNVNGQRQRSRTGSNEVA
jgi:hypothetical protein